MKSPDLTVERLREVLRYEPETGEFYWVKAISRKIKAGKKWGSLHRTGYIFGKIDSERFSGHRLAWFFVTGEWPSIQIDHRNLNRADNRWSNLREATRSQNQWNRAKSRSGISQYKGVSWHAQSRTWRARIHKYRKETALGYFATQEAAHAAYVAAAKEHFGEFARAE